MKDLLLQYAAYSSWANSQLLDAILKLPEELHRKEVPSSFTSLYKTLLHMWNAESIWWQRMRLQEPVVGPGESFAGSIKELADNLLQQNKLWQEWLSHNPEHLLQRVFQYQNTKREQFKQPVYQMLLHLFNHGTYHRGQLVTMLRQLGVGKIPQTDFIVWSRKK